MLKITFKGLLDNTVVETPYADKERKYPYLGIDEYDLLLIFFTAPNTGVVLCSTSIGSGKTGDYSTDWMEEDFFQVSTELKMIQTEDEDA